MTEFTVSVRDLVAFCHRSGDIDHRYTPSPSAAQGIEGHARIYRRRDDSYRPEYPVEYRHQEGDCRLHLRGRADGYDPVLGFVEEIKTCRGDPSAIPPAISRLHLAQAQIYAAIIAETEGLDSLEVRLTWLDIDQEQEHPLSQHYRREELRSFLVRTLARFSHWLQTLQHLRTRRQLSLDDLAFPHGTFRRGQRDIAELVYKCVAQGGQLMVEAPTGIGKTAAVLFPALKALGREKHEAMVFVTARTIGRRAAEESLELMQARGLRACSLSLSAKAAVCLSPGSACHGDDCLYANGYYDRLPAAMAEATQLGVLKRETLQEIGGRHRVCPHQLATDLLPWVDIVIADTHYVYSLQPLVGRKMEESRRWTVLLDEAHNLPERAREMYSARLSKAALMQQKRAASGPVKQALERLNRSILALRRERLGDEAHYLVLDELPAPVVDAAADVVGVVVERMADDLHFAPANPSLMDFFFGLLQWLRVAEQWGDDYRLELDPGEGSQGLSLRLNCLDPSRLLGSSHSRAHAVVAFSATLSPMDWMRQLIGLEDSAVCRQLESPFAPEQLQVELETRIDTRFRQREASRERLAARIGQFLDHTAGNCIVYFPSYRYMRNVLDILRTHPALAQRVLWEQHPEMDEASRSGLFDALQHSSDVAAFCILGGLFSEGIDLPGELLTGVVVVGVGMPQVGPERELLRQWYQGTYGQGFEYAYLYPAMQKVDQALGRVVRGDADHGHALLVDTRYGEPEYRHLLPGWWRYRKADNPLP